MADERRFVVIHDQGNFFSSVGLKIVMDTQTGVNYLVSMNGNQSSGITPLLNRDGTPVISPINR